MKFPKCKRCEQEIKMMCQKTTDYCSQNCELGRLVDRQLEHHSVNSQFSNTNSHSADLQ